MDLAQHFIDEKIAIFILTGSSARKLRHGKNINLLPGHVVALLLNPLRLSELLNREVTLEELLLYASLPEIMLEPDFDTKETDLRSYVTTYLEEEVGAEALVRNVGSFS